jgi:hypothetical protein
MKLFSMRFFFTFIILLLFSFSNSINPQSEDYNQIGKKYALVIGINSYKTMGLNNLNKARNDATYLGHTLRTLGAFDVTFMIDEEIENGDENLFPTYNNIQKQIGVIAEKATRQDTVVIFFSGHGASNSNGENYLIASDSEFTSDKALNEDTVVSVSFIVKALQNKGIQKTLIILDACRNNAKNTKGMEVVADIQDSSIDKYFRTARLGVVFFSTTQGYYSYEHKDSEFGVFTHYLIEGLEGYADKDGNGVSFWELREYVMVEIAQWSENKRQEERQKPRSTQYEKEEFGDIQLTIKKSNTRSLIARSYKDQYVLRSLIPGWGQFHDERTKTGIGYFLLGGFLGANYLFAYQTMQKDKKDYNSTIAIPATQSTGSTLAFNYLFFGAKRDSYESSVDNANFALGAFAVFYVWNIFDAYFFSGQLPVVDTRKSFAPTENSTFRFKSYKTNTYGRNEQNYEVNYTWFF